MNIIIIGAGFTGVQLAKRLINEKNEVTLIDNNEEIVRHASNILDCSVINADGNNLETLEDAGIAKANALVCVTGNDEVNMITCSLVDSVYQDILKIARVRNFSYYMNTEQVHKTYSEVFSGKHRPLYGIDYMIHPDVEAANAIVYAVESGAISDVLSFENSEYELTRINIEKKSKLIDKTLQEIRALADFSFLVAYVETNGTTKLPTGLTKINQDDSIGVLTKKSETEKLLKFAGIEIETIDKIAIVGAGKIGSLIAEKLISKEKKKTILSKIFGRKKLINTNIAIIDSDKELAKEAAHKFPSAKVYFGDITDENFLYEENITTYDLVICATHNHELNMVGAAYLESLGVGKTVSLVESAPFSEIARKLGVDVSVPLRDAVVDSILSHLRGKTVTGVHTINSGDLEIIELTLPTNSKVQGKSLIQIADPGNFLVMLIKKSNAKNYSIPIGSTTIDANDQLILIANSKKVNSILSSFGVK